MILSNQDNPLNIQVFVNFQQYVIDNIDYYIVDIIKTNIIIFKCIYCSSFLHTLFVLIWLLDGKI